MRLLKLTIIFMFIFSSFSCAAQNEVQVKSYEDYFPAENTKDENYDTYTYNDAENDEELSIVFSDTLINEQENNKEANS